MGKTNPTGYSTDVRLWLQYGDQRIALSHTAATFIIAREPIDLPPGEATVCVSIDGEVSQRAVMLPAGLSVSSKRTEIRAMQSVC